MQKVLFIHIPKTAGSSLNRTPILSKVDKKIHPFRTTIVDKIKEIEAEDYFKFCFVRNPYARFYSLYNYFYKMSESHPFHKYNGQICEVVQRYNTFEEFALAFPTLRIKNNFHFYPQSKYTFQEGNKVVDYIGRVETFKSSIDALCEILGLDSNFEIPHANQSTTGIWKDNYTTKSLQIVNEYYDDDFNFLSYEKLTS